MDEFKVRKKKEVLMELRCEVEDAILENYLPRKPSKKTCTTRKRQGSRKVQRNFPSGDAFASEQRQPKYKYCVA